jgi:hypothetical protein
MYLSVYKHVKESTTKKFRINLHYLIKIYFALDNPSDLKIYNPKFLSDVNFALN